MLKPLRKHIRLWPVGLTLVFLIGALFLITGYDAGLPLYESKDERQHLDDVYRLRGFEDEPLEFPGYPPGIMYINFGAQVLTEFQTRESAWDRACEVIRNVRITGIVVNLLTALLTALIARKLAGDWAGIIAALAWLVAPRVLAQNQFGFPQVYETLLYVAASYWAIRAVETQQGRYALLSVIAGLGAVVFKYTAFPVLGLGVGAALWQVRVNPRQWIRILALQIGLIALTAIALVVLGDVGALINSGHVESNQFLDSGLQNLMNVDLLGFIFTSGTELVGIPPIVFIGVLIGGSIIFWRQATVWQRLGWLGTVGLGLSHLVMLAMYLVYEEGIDRNVLSSSSLIVIMMVISGAVVVQWLHHRFNQPRVTQALALLLVGMWLIPQIMGSWTWIRYRSLPVTYAAMRQWADQYIPEDTMLVNDWRPFNREWSCEIRAERYVIQDEDIMDRPIAEWLDQGVYYAQLTQQRIDAMRQTPEGQAYLDQMTLLEQFPEPGTEDQWRTWRRGFEPHLALYRLWQVTPEIPAEIVFGDTIRLLGYDLNPPVIVPGVTVRMRFYWQPVQIPPADYSLFIHFTPAESPTEILAQSDGVPSRSNFRPTTTWTNLDEAFISQTFELALPDTLSPGIYSLRFGLYDWQTGERLPASEDEINIEITIPNL